MMTSKPLIAVFGATGAQGGSVADYLLKDGGFRVRALTSNPDSEKAKSILRTLPIKCTTDVFPIAGLASQGAEVVKVDVNDVKSITSAFKGAYGVFGITNCTPLF